MYVYMTYFPFPINHIERERDREKLSEFMELSQREFVWASLKFGKSLGTMDFFSKF